MSREFHIHISKEMIGLFVEEAPAHKYLIVPNFGRLEGAGEDGGGSV